MKTLALIGLVLAGPTFARDSDRLPGSSIQIEFTVSPSVLRASETSEVLACLTNQNPSSARSIAPGDSFDFAFPPGSLGMPAAPVVHSPSRSLAAGAFTATADSGVLTMTYQGPVALWAPGDSACTQVAFNAPATPVTVATRQRVANEGAFSHAAPPAILLAIGSGLGTVGPPGPVGATGPAGPPGVAVVGTRAFARSTDLAYALDNEPPEPVPGLDVTITTTHPGAELLVVADVPYNDGAECLARTFFAGDVSPLVLLEVDGVEVARRASFTNTFVWRTQGLSAGDHRVRILVVSPETNPSSHEPTHCVGSGTESLREAHMVVMELP